jgi:hypothetical protein
VTSPFGLKVPLRHPYWICAHVKVGTTGGGLGLGDGGLRNPLSETLLYIMAAERYEQADSNTVLQFSSSSSNSISSQHSSLCQAGLGE